MRASALLGIVLLCLSAGARAPGQSRTAPSVAVQQYCSMHFPKPCDAKGYSDWYNVGRYCMKYFNTEHNFADAEFACRQKAPGAHLASVHNNQANSDVFCIVMKYNNTSPRIWLGGMELFKSKKFIWLDGSAWDFQNWFPGQPDNTANEEDCVEMNWKNDARWNDVSCMVMKSSVCSFTPQSEV